MAQPDTELWWSDFEGADQQDFVEYHTSPVGNRLIGGWVDPWNWDEAAADDAWVDEYLNIAGAVTAVDGSRDVEWNWDEALEDELSALLEFDSMPVELDAPVDANAFEDPWDWTETTSDEGWLDEFQQSASAAIACAGIASAETFGAANVAGEVDPAGIASAEAIGAQVVAGEVDLAGIASSEAFGLQSIAGALIAAAIPGSETFGSQGVAGEIDPTGIVSGEAIGAPIVNPTGSTISCTGIASAEAFGSPNIAAEIDPAAIASGEVFGSAVITTTSGTISATGIASGEAFGSPFVSGEIDSAAIATAEAFGFPANGGEVDPFGIASAEAFGAQSTAAEIDPAGIATAETFGLSTVGYPAIAAAGIPSAEFIGSVVIESGQSVNYSGGGGGGASKRDKRPVQRPRAAQISGLGGIESAEAIGLPQIHNQIASGSIYEPSNFGSAQFDLGIAASWIESAAVIGKASIRKSHILDDEAVFEFLG